MTTTTTARERTTDVRAGGSLVSLLGCSVMGRARNGRTIAGDVIAISVTRESICIDGTTLTAEGVWGSDRLWVDRDGISQVLAGQSLRGTAGGVR